MTQGMIIDRRPNKGQKNLGNRQRFIQRTRSHIGRALRKNLQNRSITDTESGEKVRIPTDSIQEPTFGHKPGSGNNQRVFPGNRQYQRGDQIDRPKGGQSGKGRGGDPGDSSETGEDDFHFVLSKEEFLDLFFEDLELPDLIKKQMKQTHALKSQRVGINTSGNPANLNVIRTLKASLGRRIVLRKPHEQELATLEQQLETESDSDKRLELEAQIAQLRKKVQSVPYVDPIDLRYNVFEKRPQPITTAVMICVMDVSGSMDEHKKDVAKRFFMLLYMFLQRRYEHVKIEFIRHHTQAERVDEDTFFYDRLTGGTQVSSALELTTKLIQDEYDPAVNNVYVCQASDGDNYDADNKTCAQILLDQLLPMVQYMAYIEISDPRDHEQYPLLRYAQSKLYQTYQRVHEQNARLQCASVHEINQIYAVFRELFERK